MRSHKRPGLFVILTLITSAAFTQSCQRDDRVSSAPDSKPSPTGQEIVGRYLTYRECRNAKLKILARLTDDEGSEQAFTILAYQKCVDGVQYTLRQVTAPESERARALLTVERPGQEVENVAYLPGFEKFVEVHDLSREDTLFGLSIQESLGGYELYEYTLLGTEIIDQDETYKVEGVLKPTVRSRFPRVVAYYRQDNYLPVRMELFSLQNQLVRVRRYLEWTRIDGRWTERRTEVDNLKYNKRITFETVEADYDVDLPLSFFDRENLRNLVKGRR